MPALVPELYCQDITKSLAFYIDVLGFSIKYERKGEGFAYLMLGEAELMLDQLGETRDWLAAPLEPPFGRGINLQIKVEDVDALYKRFQDKGLDIFLEMEDTTYQCGKIAKVSRQFIVQDPDGYLLRFFSDVTRHRQASHP
ncbi:MAG: bleomycin resistance family protein [Micavibrio sp.]|nr:bleomycin resistance family protein [Micavibrio sp.]|tara:strand:+ start:383 stop:805 length:423 start_codon:yes stop_codon:yes gene_type:complete